MLIDGITLVEGSQVANLVVATGSSFPASPNEGELFYRNDGANEGLYTYNGSAWTSVASSTVTAGTLSGSTLASNVVSSSLTSVGTLGALAVTGVTTHTGATNLAGASSPLQLAGSAGTSGQVLTSAGTGATPTWQEAAAGGTPTLNATNIAFGNASNQLTGNGKLTWDNATQTLLIGTNSEETAGITANVSGLDKTFTIRTGGGNGSGTWGGHLALVAGSGAFSNSGGGNITISTGAATGSAPAGYFSVSTGTTSVGERFRITPTGAFSIGSSGTAYGTSGQVLISNGNAAPSWGSAVAQASTLTGTTLATNVVNSSLTGVGTLGTGTWQATAISAAYGGTGHQAYVIGDVLYANTSTSLARLAAGAANLVLTSNGAGIAPTWQSFAAAAGSLSGTTLSSNVIYSSLERLGTIDTGVWEGTSVAANYGGTGQTVYAIGDLLYANGTLTLAKLAAGTAGNVLVTNGAGQAPSWGGVPAGTLTGTTLASNVVSSSLTTFGTITAGVWSGTAIAANKGGTGQTGFAVGDILYAGTLSTLSKLPAGAANYVLTSNGANTAPSWQIATSATLANATILGDTAGAVTLTGIASSGSSPMTISAGLGTTPNSLTLSGSTGSGANAGGDLILKGGTATGNVSGSVTLHADGTSNARGGSVTIRGGDSAGNGTNGTAGSLTLRAGDNSNVSTGGIPGDLTLRAGNALITQPGGDVTISAGTSGVGGGVIILKTGATSTLAERFRILNNGAWSIGSTGTAYGTSGQVLTSNGNAAPTWQAAPTGDASTLSGTTLASNIVSSSLTSVGTITTGTWNGTAIAAINGGTGQTTYTTGDLLYASSSSALSKLAASTSGLVLMSNGAGVAPSWQSVAGGGADTLTGTTLAANVVSSSLTSVGTLTGLSVGGLTTITRANGTALKLLSSGSTSYTNLALGRTTEEVYLGVVGQADNFITTAAVGDFAINSGNSGAILFGINGTKAGTFTNTGFQGAVGATTKNFGGFTDIDVYSTTNSPVNFKGSTTGVEGVLYSDANIVGIFDVTGTSGFSVRPSVPKASIWTGNVERVIVDSTGISTGVWNATTIGTTKGGTGLTSYTTGDILYASASNTLSKLAVGSNGQVLTLAAGVPAWGSAGSGSVTSVSVTTANGVSGSVANASTTPAITLTLGAITPSSVAATGAVSATTTVTGSNLSTTTLALGGGTLGGGFITVANSTNSSVPDLTISAGSNTSTTSVAGDLILQGGTYGPAAGGTSAAGDVFIRGGDNNGNSPTGTTGNVVLTAGGGTSATGGSVIFATQSTGTTKVNRMVILPSTGHVEAGADNTQTMGTSGKRWNTIFAGTGAINTSDENLKEQITSLSAAELAVAQTAKALLKKFKFKDAVLEKGTGARWHFGIIAQDLEAAFSAQGLDANDYGVFCSDTWFELDGVTVSEETPGAIEITRLGVRYEELLAFIISAM